MASEQPKGQTKYEVGKKKGRKMWVVRKVKTQEQRGYKMGKIEKSCL